MAITLALAAALLWGLTDYVGGVMSRRASTYQVGVAELACAVVCVIPAAIAFDGSATGPDYAWASAGGLCGGVATAFFYRGLARGRMGIVAPVSAVGTALVPTAFGFALGDRPGALAWAGVAVAFPAIWLLASSDEPAGEHHESTGLLDASVAGVIYGLLFVCLGQVGDHAGMMPLVALQLASLAGMILAALAARKKWLPRDRYTWRAAWLGPVVAAAIAGFQLALHHGYLTIVSVIGSLYPAVTVVLAAALLKERIHAWQAAGLMLAAVAVTLVAIG